MRALTLTPLVALICAATACDNGDSGPTAPESEAAVQGRIESTVSTASAGAGSPAQAAQLAQNATAVIVARVNASGGTETVAEGTLEGSAYTVAGVPTGVAPLVVIARDAEGSEVGRAIVQGELTADETVVVTPIDAETTLEAMALAALRAGGDEAAAANTGELAAFVHMSPAEAEATLSSSSRVDLVAEAYRRVETSITASLEEAGADLDADTRADVAVAAARQYAMQRDGGASVELAHDAFVEGVLSAYANAGASDMDLVVATAVAATTATRPAEDFEEGVRIALARQTVSVNLRARERLAASSAGGSTTANALANARVSVSGASSMAELEADVEDVVDARGTVGGLVLDLVSEFSLTVQLNVEEALEAAIEASDLSARLQGRISPQTAASASAGYEAEVTTMVDDIAAQIPAGVDFDAETTTRLLIAVDGSAWIG